MLQTTSRGATPRPHIEYKLMSTYYNIGYYCTSMIQTLHNIPLSTAPYVQPLRRKIKTFEKLGTLCSHPYSSCLSNLKTYTATEQFCAFSEHLGVQKHAQRTHMLAHITVKTMHHTRNMAQFIPTSIIVLHVLCSSPWSSGAHMSQNCPTRQTRRS